MSKSVRRVRAALDQAGITSQIVETPHSTRTAAEAAAVVGCEVDAIAKSMVFAGADSGRVYLFLTAGGRQVDERLAAGVAGEPLARADAARVRAVTGFAIGGVAPVGHLEPVPAFLDIRLDDFAFVWAAAGTPNHLFEVAPDALAVAARATRATFSRLP